MAKYQCTYFLKSLPADQNKLLLSLFERGAEVNVTMNKTYLIRFFSYVHFSSAWVVIDVSAIDSEPINKAVYVNVLTL